MSIQLPLGIGLRDDASFDNFISGANAEAVSAVQRNARSGGGEPIIYLWGGDGVGKTHLLQAACHQASAQGEAAAYIPLAQAGELSPAMLEGLEQLALVCIDDIQAIAAQPAWEAALFHLYNRLRDSGTRCIIAGNAAPAGLALRLPDLVSRLAWGLVLHLATLDDEGLLAALQLRARNRGLDMPEEVAQFLLRRHSRDMPLLFALLDRLDHASLTAQRRLTIPFVKGVVG
ncbi:MAG: DnaA regulatory inactivator Hda [Gammaproteobacteria bacterium]|nr:DnaA regulatory inactivator Hda [Gammaproteobacteria bacterium]